MREADKNDAIELDAQVPEAQVPEVGVEAETPAGPTRRQRLLQAWATICRIAQIAWAQTRRVGRWSVESLRAVWAHRVSVATRRASREGLRTAIAWCAAKRSGFLHVLFRVARVAGVAGVLTLAVLWGGRYALHSVAPGEVGVRYSKWGGGGVMAQDFGPGLHLGLLGVHKWHTLNAGTRLMSWHAGGGGGDEDWLELRTRDGNQLRLSLSIPYRIEPGQAHRIVSEGQRNTYEAVARAKAQQVLLAELQRLSSEEFADPGARQAHLAEALAKLNDSLRSVHVKAEGILVDELRYPEAYEKKLNETQRERQVGLVLAASQLVREEESTIRRRRLEIDEQLQALRIERERDLELVERAATEEVQDLAREIASYEAQVRADADREYQSLVTEGEVALLESQSLEKRLRREILAGEGGREYLALQAAKKVGLKEVILNANDLRVPNAMDVGAMVKLFRSAE